MHKYYIYIAIAILVLILFFMYSRCSKSSGGNGGDGGVEVTYYFNPGCPHCRNFMPAWKDFTSDGGAQFTEINCSEQPGRCQGVRGVPWVVFSKNGSQPVPYTGDRTKEALQTFMKSL